MPAGALGAFPLKFLAGEAAAVYMGCVLPWRPAYGIGTQSLSGGGLCCMLATGCED